MDASTEFLSALPVAVYATDASGFVTFYNASAAELWGFRPAIGEARWCGAWRLLTPDGKAMPAEEGPVARSLRTGTAVIGKETLIERPDGTRVPVLPSPTILKDQHGVVTGSLNVLENLAERERASIESARLAAIVASSEDAIISKTLDGRVTSWNAGATRIFGYEAEEMIGQPITKLIPPELYKEEVDIVAKLQAGERVDHFDTERIAKDGRRINVSLTISPLRDRTGRVVGASNVSRDISDRRQSEDLQRLLFDELNHRVKNTLATIQAIASQSLRRAASPQDFVTSFSGRVQALARAHDLLVRRLMRGADIMSLIRDQVVLDSADGARTTCAGPLLELDAQSAVQLALVLHELATNARKFGALSVIDGKLSIEWGVADNVLSMRWKESGTPLTGAPSKRGFGTTLIERTLQGSRGSANVRYEPDGVACDIRMPLLTPEMKPREWRAAESQPLTVPAPSQDAMLLKGRRILVIEDEPLVAMDIEQHLAAAGCESVGVAGSIDQARRLIAEREFDAALLDANLRGERVDEIAELLTRRNVPFTFASGYDREALPAGFAEAGYLSKPFSAGQLCAAIARMLDRPSM